MKKLTYFVLFICLFIMYGCSSNKDKKVTITFVSNGGSVIDPIELTEDTELINPIKKGYDFIGWYNDSSFSEEVDIKNLTKSCTLYAKWEKHKYKVVFMDQEDIMDTQYIEYGLSAKAPDTDKNDYYFLGWDKNFHSITTDSTINANYVFNKSTEGLKIDYVNNQYEVISYEGSSTEVFIPSYYNNTLVTSIATNAFLNNNVIEKVHINSSIKTINECAFKNCINLNEVYFEEGCQEMKSEIFSGCTSLKIINIPNGIKIINDYTFSDCSSLVTLILPDSVERIESSAFPGCVNLELLVANKVNYIGNYVFGNNAKMQFLIPDQVTYIGNACFTGCTTLNTPVPSSLTALGYSAFNGCSSMKEIVVPGTVFEISSNAFNGCTSATKIVVNEGVKIISGGALANCNNAISMTLPSTLVTIASGSLKGNKQIPCYTKDGNIENLRSILTSTNNISRFNKIEKIE